MYKRLLDIGKVVLENKRYVTLKCMGKIKATDNSGQIFLRKRSIEPMAQMNQNCFSNFKYQIANLSGSFIWLEKLPGFYFTYSFFKVFVI